MLIRLPNTSKSCLKAFVLLLFACAVYTGAQAQCVPVKDPRNNNQFTFYPRKQFACLTPTSPRNATLFRIEFQSTAPIGTVIVWGDGSPNTIVTSATAMITHTWADTGIFVYRIVEPGCPDTIKGRFINEVNVRTPGIGFVFPPAGTDNRRCLPVSLDISNYSPGMNGFSEFLVDWGGQEKKDTIDITSYSRSLRHTYKPGSRICRTRMTVTYSNICGALPGQQPLSQSAGDYYFMEKDSALANPMKVVICSPVDLLIKDASKLNCLDTSGRKIAWRGKSGFAAPLTSAPGVGAYISYNKAASKQITIPASAFTPTPSDSTYKLELFLKNACGIDTAEITITMAQPKAPVFSLLNNNTCPGEIVRFANNTMSQYPDGILEYRWDFGDGSPVVANNAAQVEHAYMIGGSYICTLSCVVLTTVSGQVCKKTSTVNVNVRRSATPILLLNPSEVCNRGVVKIQNKSVNTQSVVWSNWQLDDQPAWPGGNGFLPVRQPGQDTSLVAIRNTNLSDSSVTVAFKNYGRYVLGVTAQSQGCPNFDFRDTLDIYPTPTLRWRSLVRKVCVGTPFQMRDSSVVFATDSNGLPRSFRNLTWQIDMGDSTKYASTAPVSTNFDSPSLSNRVTSHYYRRPGLYKVVLTVWVGKKNCPQTDTIIIQALPAPLPVFSFTRNRCDNQHVRLVNNTTDSSTFYKYQVLRGTVLAANYIRTDRQPFDAVLPFVPPGDSTYYYVTLKAYTIAGTDTCVSLSSIKRIAVAPTPVVDFTASQTDGCSPMLGVTFNNASFNMAIDTSNRFRWSFGNGRTSAVETPPAQDFINNTTVLHKDTVNFSITRRDGCVYANRREIYIFPGPNVVMTAPDSICSGVNAEISADGNNLTQYIWSFADYDQSNDIGNPIHKTFTNYTPNAKIYNIELTARTVYNCPQTVTRQIKIFPQPQVDIDATPYADKHCSPMQVNFGYQNVSGANIFKWYFSDTDSVTYLADTAFTRTFTDTGAAPSIHTVRLVASNGGRCSTSVSRSITVNPEVRASFSLNRSEGCHPLAILANNTSTVGGDQLTWYVGSQIVQNQVLLNQTLANLSPVRDTVYNLRLITRNSLAPQCRDTANRSILIHPKPRLDGISMPSSTGCSPLVSALVASGRGIKRYAWSFGDGDAATDTTGLEPHTYENYNPTADRIYTTQVIGSNQFGCADTSARTVTVRPYTSAGIVTQDTVGCSPFLARFSSAGSVNANRFDWTFGTQTTSNDADPIVTLTNTSDTAQRIRVRLIAEKTQVQGCPDTSYVSVLLYPKPVVDFTLSATIGCGPLPVQIHNSSRLFTSSYWIISSGGVSDTIRDQTDIDTVFNNPNLINKTVQVDLYVTSGNGCVSTKRDFITVYADVTAVFELQQEGCHPLAVGITNRSSNHAGHRIWDFGDHTARDTTQNPRHTFTYTGSAGDTTYWVKLTSISQIGGCSRTDSLPVTVHGRPANNFFLTDPANRHLQLPNNTVTIKNTTPFYPSWHYRWTFDDGKSDTTRNQTFNHQYDFSFQDFTDTVFTITQIAYNDYGCTDTLRQNIIIQPEAPVPAFTYADSAGCSPLSVAFYNRSTYGREYQWEFGDKGVSIERDPVHVYTRAGKYTVKLTVSGFGGIRSLVRDTVIEVMPFGSALFNTIPASGLEVVIPEKSVEFRPLYSCPDCHYDWDFGDGIHSQDMYPLHLYKEAGIWPVALTVTSPNGCVSSDTVPGAVRTVNKKVIIAPNAFRPSKNGSSGGYITYGIDPNTVFYPFTAGVTKINMTIYNRWGQLLFQSKELNRGWDGYVSNVIAPMETYVYRIEATFGSGETRTAIGDVTLIH